MFKWLGKKIEKFTTIFHSGVVIKNNLSSTENIVNISSDNLTSGSGISLDIDDPSGFNPGAHAQKTLLDIDYDKASVVGDMYVNDTHGLSINIADAATNHSGSTVELIGAKINIDSASNSGTIKQKGLTLEVAADGVGDTAYTSGIEMRVMDGGTDIKMMSHANNLDYCAISVKGNGGTKIQTIDASHALAHFEIAADGDITLDAEGQIKLEPVAGNNILLDGTVTVDGGAVGGLASLTSSADLAIVATGNDITVDTDTFTIESSTTAVPVLKLKSTASDSTEGELVFEKLRADDGVASGQNLGAIWFRGEDSNQNPEDYAYIIGEIDVGTSGEESGQLVLGVANDDGGNGAGLILTGGSEDDEIDVTVGLGGGSVVTIPGNIDLAGNMDVDGTLEVDAFKATGSTTIDDILDEDAMGSDSASALATQQSIKAYVDDRYSYAYMTWSASGISSMDGSDPEWIFPHSSKGIYEEDWNKDENITATSAGATAFTVSKNSAVNGLVIPHAGQCVGFHAHGYNKNNDVTFRTGLFHLEGSTTGTTNNGGVDYGNSGNTHECTLRWIANADEAEASGGADGTSSDSFQGPCKLVSNTTAITVSAGDVLLPAIMGPDASDEIFVTMTIILKIPVTIAS